MATKEQSMNKWIFEMNKYELLHVERLVCSARERLQRIADIEQAKEEEQEAYDRLFRFECELCFRTTGDVFHDNWFSETCCDICGEEE